MAESIFAIAAVAQVAAYAHGTVLKEGVFV